MTISFDKKKFLICKYLNDALPNFEDFTQHIANVILFTFDDQTIQKILQTPITHKFTQQLKNTIIRPNHLFNSDSHPIGVLISTFFNSGAAQNILNVKHIDGIQSQTNIQIPQINTTSLHRKTNNLTWFRLRVTNHHYVKQILSEYSTKHTYNIINDTIAELVYETTPNKTARINVERDEYIKYSAILNTSPYVDEIIFFSNCMDHNKEITNTNITYSNIFKFLYCILFNKLDTTLFDDDIDNIIPLQIHATILQLHTNFNTNQSGIIDPISLLSSEKNSSALIECANKYYATGAPRDLLLLGHGSEIGGISKQIINLQIPLSHQHTSPQTHYEPNHTETYH